MIELKVTSLLPTRLDKYLMQEFPALGLGRLNKALRENKIKLNGKKQPLSTRVLNGDKITLYLKDEQLGLAEAGGPLYLQARCPAEIVYQDEKLMIVNKPAGLMVVVKQLWSVSVPIRSISHALGSPSGRAVAAGG